MKTTFWFSDNRMEEQSKLTPDEIKIVGAIYDMNCGKVEFFENL